MSAAGIGIEVISFCLGQMTGCLSQIAGNAQVDLGTARVMAIVALRVTTKAVNEGRILPTEEITQITQAAVAEIQAAMAEALRDAPAAPGVN